MLLLHETNPKMPAEVERGVSAPFAAWNDSVPYFFLFLFPSLFFFGIYLPGSIHRDTSFYD